MRKTFLVARREFVATALTRGFLIGAIVFPFIMLLVMIVVVPLLVNVEAPRTVGSIAIIDLTAGQAVAPLAAERLGPAALEAERAAEAAEAMRQVERLAENLPPGQAAMVEGSARGAMAGGAGGNIELIVEVLDPGADVEAAKEALRVGKAGDAGRLAVVVIAASSIERDGEGRFGAFQTFVRPRLDERVQSFVTRGVRDAVRDARLAHHGFDAAAVGELTRVDAPETVTVTADGERTTLGGAQFFVPIAFMMLLWISAFTGGQYLLTTTIEEKSNRIMEVLLSATSPMELMVGKILGQMAVGLFILGVYATVGFGALSTFALLDLLDPANIGYLIVYFFIAYFFVAALMAAVGSAVSDVHEAQSLIGPVMMVLVLPMILMPAIITDPNSTLALVLSFVPPVSPFMMVLRIAASTEPLPFWQIGLSIAIGVGSVVVAAWAAAKIFRIGALMYGKPPNFLTLLRWIRMA